MTTIKKIMMRNQLMMIRILILLEKKIWRMFCNTKNMKRRIIQVAKYSSYLYFLKNVLKMIEFQIMSPNMDFYITSGMLAVIVVKVKWTLKSSQCSFSSSSTSMAFPSPCSTRNSIILFNSSSPFPTYSISSS